MNPIQFLNKLKWTGKDLDDYSLIILHRGAPGDRKEVSCKNMELGRTFFSTGRSRIPGHRILEIRKGKQVLWKR
jgi:uncharacterized protein (UPF0248 family)